MVEARDKRIRRIDVQDMGFVLNPDFPGAISAMASFPYSTYDASGTSIPDDMPVSEVLKLSPRFFQIGSDINNNVFYLGDDAIVTAYDLNGVARSEIPIAEEEIILKETERLKNSDKKGFYKGAINLAVVEQDFPMYYGDGDVVQSASHVVVLKNYKRCLAAAGQESKAFEVTSISKSDENPIRKGSGRAKKKGSWIGKIFKR